MGKYDHIREEALAANCRLPALGLVTFTFGNVSAADQGLGVFAIKPSGVAYEELSDKKMVVVDFDGKVIEGKLRPSSDTPTHALLYKHMRNIGGIAHTHSTYATAWAQSVRDIPIYGTTHADYLARPVPCTAVMSDAAIRKNYEVETGRQILGCLKNRKLDSREYQMILVGGHAPFTWGKDAEAAVHNSAVLEFIARLASITEQLNPEAAQLKRSLIRKHHERKHGPKAYYGQSKSK
jgi:L-ribulose-5-phosphate 4-epimerase